MFLTEKKQQQGFVENNHTGSRTETDREVQLDTEKEQLVLRI
jgi:hypothetical protein